MTMMDVKAVQAEARKELVEEATKKAKEALKEKYRVLEKAKLAVRNLERDIESYLNEISDLATYEAAGVDVSGSK
jgi:hypothetical protein